MSVFRIGIVCWLAGASLSAVLGADERLDIAPVATAAAAQTRLSFSVEIPPFELIAEKDWTVLRCADAKARPWGEVGRPETFALRRLISIPAGAQVVSVELQAQPEATPLSRPLRPGVESIPWDQPRPVPAPDPAVYLSDQPYPARDFDCRIVRQGTCAMLELTLYPFKYVGARQTLIAHRKMDLDILLDCPAWPAATEPWNEMDRRLLRRVVNPESVCFARATRPERAASRGLVSGDQADYVLIAPAAWTNALDNYVAAKSAEGYSPRVFSVEAIYAAYPGGGGRTNILNFIRDAFSNWPVSHVLLVGDLGQIPSGDWTYEFDLYYALLDGPTDYYPDLYLGRLPATTRAEAQTIADRWAQYQPRGWSRREFCLTGEDIGFPATNDFEAYGWTVVSMEGSNVFHSLTTNDVLAGMDAPCGLISWCGHGNPNFWSVEGGDYVGDPTNFNYHARDAWARTQTNLAFVDALISCDAGRFSDPDYVAPSFLRAPDSGVIGYVGANDTVWLDGVNIDTPAKTYFDAALREEYLETGYAHPPANWLDAIAGNLRWVKLFNLLGDPTARMDLRRYLDLQDPQIDRIDYSRTNILAGETIAISVAASDNDQVGVVKVLVHRPDGTWDTNALPFNPTANRYAMDFGQERTAQTGSYAVAIYARDISQNQCLRFGSNLWVNADPLPPQITAFGAAPTSTYQMESIALNYAATDNVALAECYVDVTRPGLDVERLPLHNGFPTYYTNTGVAGVYQMQAGARDYSGQIATSNASVQILADTQPPLILDAWSAGAALMGGAESIERLWWTNGCPAQIFFNVVATDNVTGGWSLQSYVETTAPDSSAKTNQLGADGFWPEHFQISQSLVQTGTYAITYTARDKVGNTARSGRQYFHVTGGGTIGAVFGDLSRQTTQLWLQVAAPGDRLPRIDVSTNLLSGGAWRAIAGAGIPVYTNGYYLFPFPATNGPELFYRAASTN